MKNKTISIVLSAALFVLSGCGSSTSSDSNSKSTSQTHDKQSGITVTDPKSGFRVTFSKVNSAPIAKLDRFSINSGVAYNGKLLADDKDGDTLSYEIVSKPKHGTIKVSKNGTFTYIPEERYVGKDSFSYIAKDEINACSPKEVEIEVAQKPITIPNAPSNLKLEAVSTCKIHISWDDNSDNEQGFDIYRDGELVSVNGANDTVTNICGDMQPATTYTIEVRARNEAGSSKGVSGEVTTKDITQAPIAPTNLRIVSVDKNAVRIAWDDNSWSESGFEIYQDGKLIKELGKDCTCTVIDGLEPNASYDFVVKAKNKIGSTSSNTLTVETEGIPVITLNGGDEELILGDIFKDKGVTAIDKEDGNLTVVITGDVDTSKEGTYTIIYEATDKDGNSATKSRIVTVKAVSLEDRAYIPYDSNLELGGEEGIVYYVDPRPEENGKNRALKIDTINWTFEELPTKGINPHSLDRVEDSNRFYVRTQNSHSFDIVNFDDKSVKTVEMGAHKPRAIGATNLKHHLQLISVKNRAVIDVIDTTTDKIIARLGDDRDENVTGEYNYDRSKLTSNAGSGSATGHSFWLDSDHFALIDRVNKKVVVYKVIDQGGIKTFKETSSLPTQTAIHSAERIVNPVTKADLVTFYETGEGDLSKGIDPYVQEIIFDPQSGKLSDGRKTVLSSASKEKIEVSPGFKKPPSTHHLRITPDRKYIYVPTFDSKLHIIDRATMKLVKVLPAGFGAAHVTFSKPLHLAVITNHFDKFLTIVDTNTNEVVKDITITDHEFHGHLLQPHFSYVSEDGKYYYTFDTQGGDFLKVNLETLEVEEKLHVGGAPEQAHS